MPLIEGLGDEVTLVMGGIVICVILMFAWFSTHTGELPAIHEVGITVIERTQIRRRVTPVHSPEPGGENAADFVNAGGQSGSSTDASDEATAGEDTGVAASSSTGVTVTTRAADIIDDAASAAQGSASVIEDSEVASTSNTSLLATPAVESVTGAVGYGDQQGGGEDTNTEHKDGEKEVSAASIPAADIVVDAQTGSRLSQTPLSEDLPAEEEVRRRRVQYFQSNPNATATDSTVQTASSNTACINSNTQGIDSKPETADATAGPSIKTSSLTPRVSPLPSDTGDASVSTTSNQAQSESTTATSPQGQGSQQSAPRIRVKLKYMNETQRSVQASPQDTIGDFRRTHFQEELQDGNKWVRFIFNGQDLRDDSATLQAYQVGDNCTMHCLITNKVRSPSSPGGGAGSGALGRDEEDEDSVMGALMYRLFTLVLVVVWYFRLTYRQYFSPISTVCLIGFSFLLGLGYFSSMRTAAATEPIATGGAMGRTNQPGQGQGQGQATAGHPHSD